MRVHPLALPGVLLIEPSLHRDARGCFLEAWNARRYRGAGLPDTFVQDNVSWSVGGTLRGLHAQSPGAQGKLVSVLLGEVFDVAVDIRRDSPTFGEWVSATLSADSGRQIWVPPGFAHGFAVTSREAIVAYKCTAYYAPDAEFTVLWNDPDLAIDWPLPDPTLSDKDRRGSRLGDLPLERLPSLAGVTG